MEPSPQSSASESNDIVQQNLLALMRACDIVFGSTTVALALLGTWFHFTHSAHLGTVLALWYIPAFNVLWSRLTKRFDRVRADLVRNLFSLPVATFLYVAESGTLIRLWYPSLVLLVYFCLSLGIGTRRAYLGYLVTCSYASSVFIASVVEFGGVDFASISVAFGLAATGVVISQVAAHLGRSLDEARRYKKSAPNRPRRCSSSAARSSRARSTVCTSRWKSARGWSWSYGRRKSSSRSDGSRRASRTRSTRRFSS